MINENAWAGSTANVYIAKAVLEEDLGCEVEVTKVAEIPVFQAMADGQVDAVLEDWQHVDEYDQYIEKAGTVVMGGPLGAEGSGGPVPDARVRRPGHVPGLPPRAEDGEDCKDDAKEGGDPAQYRCEYDITVINKLFSKEFAESGSPAFDVLKKMELTNEDQEAVAKAIAGDKVDPDQAGQDWVADNRDTVDAWLQ